MQEFHWLQSTPVLVPFTDYWTTTKFEVPGDSQWVTEPFLESDNQGTPSSTIIFESSVFGVLSSIKKDFLARFTVTYHDVKFADSLSFSIEDMSLIFGALSDY